MFLDVIGPGDGIGFLIAFWVLFLLWAIMAVATWLSRPWR